MVFWKKKSPVRRLQILIYEVQNNVLTYTPYVGDDMEGIPKVLDIEGVEDFSAFAKANMAQRTFYLGTDKYGRDLLSRMLIGRVFPFPLGLLRYLYLWSSVSLWELSPDTLEVE